MTSEDLEHWSVPELLRVKGPSVTQADMRRMIDPYLIRDRLEPNVWWCFYKDHGINLSRSVDLETWVPVGPVSSGENPCVIVDGDEYLLFYSPENGIGMKRSLDLKLWHDLGLLTLGQKDWPWASGRITAGFVLDLRDVPEVGRALMFFHGSRYPRRIREEGLTHLQALGSHGALISGNGTGLEAARQLHRSKSLAKSIARISRIRGNDEV